MRAHAIGVRAIEQRGIGGHAKTARNRLPDTLHRYLVPAFAANRKIVMLALAVQVNGECKVFAGLEGSKFFLQQECISAKVNILLALHQAGDDFGNLRMHKRLATGDAHHGCAALFHCLKALLRRQVLLKNMGGILDLPAAGAGQIAAK